MKILAPQSKRVHTLTADNGKEFGQHEAIAKALNADFYFGYLYLSWEGGLNENTNGLIRQYFPKSCDFTIITQKDLDHSMHKLNNQPRKCLGVKTLNQVCFVINPFIALVR